MRWLTGIRRYCAEIKILFSHSKWDMSLLSFIFITWCLRHEPQFHFYNVMFLFSTHLIIYHSIFADRWAAKHSFQISDWLKFVKWMLGKWLTEIDFFDLKIFFRGFFIIVPWAFTLWPVLALHSNFFFSLNGIADDVIKWTILLKKAASLLRNFLPWSFAVLTLLSLNVLS